MLLFSGATDRSCLLHSLCCARVSTTWPEKIPLEGSLPARSTPATPGDGPSKHSRIPNKNIQCFSKCVNARYSSSCLFCREIQSINPCLTPLQPLLYSSLCRRWRKMNQERGQHLQPAQGRCGLGPVALVPARKIV